MTGKSNAMKHSEPAAPAAGKTPSRPIAVPRSARGNEDAGFDRLIYERVRLGIMSALAVNERLTFNELTVGPAERAALVELTQLEELELEPLSQVHSEISEAEKKLLQEQAKFKVIVGSPAF